MLQQAAMIIMNMLRINRKNKISPKKKKYRKETNRNFRTAKYNNGNLKNKNLRWSQQQSKEVRKESVNMKIK